MSATQLSNHVHSPRPTRAEPTPRSGDVADFTSEAWPHREVLYAAALRYTRNPSDADDLVQETFMRALGAWRGYTPGTSCRAWLLRILRNSFINHVRKRRRQQRFAYESGDDAVRALYGETPPREGDPEARIVESELGDEVVGALASLRSEYRDVVERADLRGQGYRAIAEGLGLPIGTVMSRLYRARRQLEAELSAYAAEDYGIACRGRRAA
jgi:RNA polymerase sigma-70 factor, ECF subfamily